MKKLFAILSILLALLTIAGAAYYLLHRDSANVGYATIPMLATVGSLAVYRWIAYKQK